MAYKNKQDANKYYKRMHGRPHTLTGPLVPLVDRLGESGLCEALGGVSPSTIWRWDKGLSVPQKTAQALLGDIFRANGLVPHRWPKRTKKG